MDIENNRGQLNIENYLLYEKKYTNKKEDIIKRTKIEKYSDIRKTIVLLSEEYVDISNTELA